MPLHPDDPRADMIDVARQVATAAHAGQVRQFGPSAGEPYITHPLVVATVVSLDGGDHAEVAAALLHDTVEDTDLTVDEIRDVFGDDIADLVDALTRRDGETHADYINRVIAAGPHARRIKRADVSHNIATLPPDHSLRHRYEKVLIALELADA